MSRCHSRAHRDPSLIHVKRHSQMNSLQEAKLAAWALAIGEVAPEPGRRRFRPATPNLPSPEPPPAVADNPGKVAYIRRSMSGDDSRQEADEAAKRPDAA